MRKGMHIGAGPVHLFPYRDVEWENSDGAPTHDEKGNEMPAATWGLDRVRDFTKPFADVEDNSIDYILFWHCVEHLNLSEKDDVLKEFLRILKPGGEIFIACPDVQKIAQHIVNRDGPWADWFICAVNIFGPYNGFVGDYHKWGYNFEELGKVMAGLGYQEYRELQPHYLESIIGPQMHTDKSRIGFAEYNIQAVARK